MASPGLSPELEKRLRRHWFQAEHSSPPEDENKDEGRQRAATYSPSGSQDAAVKLAAWRASKEAEWEQEGSNLRRKHPDRHNFESWMERQYAKSTKYVAERLRAREVTKSAQQLQLMWAHMLKGDVGMRVVLWRERMQQEQGFVATTQRETVRARSHTIAPMLASTSNQSLAGSINGEAGSFHRSSGTGCIRQASQHGSAGELDLSSEAALVDHEAAVPRNASTHVRASSESVAARGDKGKGDKGNLQGTESESVSRLSSGIVRKRTETMEDCFNPGTIHHCIKRNADLGKFGWEYSEDFGQWELWDKGELQQSSWLDGSTLEAILQSACPTSPSTSHRPQTRNTTKSRKQTATKPRTPIPIIAEESLKADDSNLEEWRVWYKAGLDLIPCSIRCQPSDTIYSVKEKALGQVKRSIAYCFVKSRGWHRVGVSDGKRISWKKYASQVGRRMGSAAGRIPVEAVSKKSLYALYVEEVHAANAEYQSLVESGGLKSLSESEQAQARIDGCEPMKDYLLGEYKVAGQLLTANDLPAYYKEEDRLPGAATLKQCGLSHNETIGFQPKVQRDNCCSCCDPVRMNKTSGHSISEGEGGFRTISEKVFQLECTTGDIVLFDSPWTNLGSFCIKCCTASKWDHVGLVIKNKSGKTYIVESLSDGVQINPWNEVRDKVQKSQGDNVIYWRPLLDPLSPDQEWILNLEAERMKGREWEDSVSELVKAWWSQDSEGAMSGSGGCCRSKASKQDKMIEDTHMQNVFCSELTAHLYKKAGLVPQQHIAHNYLPKDFANDTFSRLPPLQHGAYLSNWCYLITPDDRMEETRHTVKNIATDETQYRRITTQVAAANDDRFIEAIADRRRTLAASTSDFSQPQSQNSPTTEQI